MRTAKQNSALLDHPETIVRWTFELRLGAMERIKAAKNKGAEMKRLGYSEEEYRHLLRRFYSEGKYGLKHKRLQVIRAKSGVTMLKKRKG
jgi:hypothetical protein